MKIEVTCPSDNEKLFGLMMAGAGFGKGNRVVPFSYCPKCGSLYDKSYPPKLIVEGNGEAIGKREKRV